MVLLPLRLEPALAQLVLEVTLVVTVPTLLEQLLALRRLEPLMLLVTPLLAVVLLPPPGVLVLRFELLELQHLALAAMQQQMVVLLAVLQRPLPEWRLR